MLTLGMFMTGGIAWAQTTLDSARKEGHVVFYASMETQSAQKITAGFEKKYPFIKVDAVRIGSEKMATRLIAEAQARKVTADVVHQSSFDFHGVLQKGLFDSYHSPERGAFPAEYRDDKGFWLLNSATLNVIAYNTRRFPGLQTPRSFWELTEAKWKGQLIMDENESKWMAGMMSYFGEAKALELMLKKEGAPIEWVAAEPVIGLTFGVGLVKGAPHPAAARLFIDFLLSREGQEIIGTAGYFVPRVDVSSPILKEAPPTTKVIPLPMTLAIRYNEYFQLYRKIMRLH
jgi:iron(III) transport system substrate-binding protein